MKGKIRIGRIAALTLALLVLAGIVAYRYGVFQPLGFYRPSNSLMVIAPYKYQGTWVFDDAAVGLKREPFVSGIPEMIDTMVKEIPDADKGFRLLFSTQPFPGHMVKLSWRRADSTGNWYYCEQYDAEGWLCPGLFKYYAEAPKDLYAKAEKK